MSRRTRGRLFADTVVVLLTFAAFGGLVLHAAFRPNERSKRLACMAQLRQIGLTLIMWENDQQAFPPPVDAKKADVEPARARFAWLLKRRYITNAKVFLCPSTKDRLPADFPKDFRKAKVADLVFGARNCSYGLDADKTPAATGAALVSDKPQEQGRNQDSEVNSANHLGDGQNVLYRDGHVAWSRTVKSDSGRDPNIFAGDKDNNSRIDSNIDPSYSINGQCDAASQ